MSFTDVIKKSVLEGFNNGDLSTTGIIVILMVTLLLSAYVYFVYTLVNKGTMYDREYHISMAMISVVTAGIIIAMQSNIVISLGMVGALSIVRFRTAIKSPMDLLFLFWSIGNGIICGAGLFEVAIIVSLMVSIGIWGFEFLPGVKKPYLLIVRTDNELDEDVMIGEISKFSKQFQIKSRNHKKSNTDYLIELKTKQEKELLSALGQVNGVEEYSLMTQTGEVRF